MKTAISIPDGEFKANEEAALRHHMNRSEFYSKAAALYRDYLDAGRSAKTEQIDDAVAHVGQPGSGQRIDDAAAATFENVEW